MTATPKLLTTYGPMSAAEIAEAINWPALPRVAEVCAEIVAEYEAEHYCPHGYGECWLGCAYPGRCGRFCVAEQNAAERTPCSPCLSSPGPSANSDSPNGVSHPSRAASLDETESAIQSVSDAPESLLCECCGTDQGVTVRRRLHTTCDLCQSRLDDDWFSGNADRAGF